jgi:hypothetical protein
MVPRRWAQAAAGLAARGFVGAVALLALFMFPTVALGTSTGACTASAQTSRGTVDLAGTAILHVASTDQIVFTAAAPTLQDKVTVSVDMLGYPVLLVDAISGGSGGSSGTYHFDVSTVAKYGRSAQVSANSAGPSGPCAVTVQIVIDDVDALGTPLGLVASAGAGLGAAALAAGLLLPVAIAPMLIVAGVLLLAAGGSTMLQQLALPIDPRIGPSAVAASLPSLIEILSDPATIGAALVGALIVAILMPFPSELFNRTVERNRDEIRGWFTRIPIVGRVARGESEPVWQRGFLGGLLSIAIAGLLSAALDPAFGPNLQTGLAWLASAVAIFTVINTKSLPERTAQRRQSSDRGHLSMVIGALPIAILGVVISRIVGYLPGYLYGVIMVWVFARELSARDEAGTAERGAWWMLILAVSSWLMLSAARAGTIEGSIPGLLLTSALSAVTVAGIEAVVFAMAPVGGLGGAKLFRVSRVRWAVLYAVGLLLFILVILNPENGFAAAPDQVSFVTAVSLFVAYGLFSILFWAFFALRHRQAPATPAGT